MSFTLQNPSYIQDLWSGYGSIRRGRLADGRPVVEKEVTPPGGTGLSHERKLKSYHNEKIFYEKYASMARDRGVAIAESYLLEETGGGRWRFVLEDLRPRFPKDGNGDLTETETRAALAWLADFHSTYVGVEAPDLWENGSYWHLATRPDEFHNMGPAFSDLKQVAQAVDARIHRPCAHRTLVHGDSKCENFLFTRDGRACAAYDFQYCGLGIGALDVAYLISSSIDASALKKETELLQFYHQRFLQGAPGLQYSFEDFLGEYEVCVLDFARFLAGWGWFGNTAWLRAKVKDILERRKSEFL